MDNRQRDQDRRVNIKIKIKQFNQEPELQP